MGMAHLEPCWNPKSRQKNRVLKSQESTSEMSQRIEGKKPSLGTQKIYVGGSGWSSKSSKAVISSVF